MSIAAIAGLVERVWSQTLIHMPRKEKWMNQKLWLRKTVLFLGILALAGCASSGSEQIKNQTQTSISQQLKEGVTTKAEVQDILGNPGSTTFTDKGGEIWVYKHAHATPKAQNFIPIVNLISRGADVKVKELAIFFDVKGVVSKYTLRESDQVLKSGLAH
jgi:outer membrane protein assembly factor BamE (lipoprotein component of BamABCDE complex)